MAQPSASSAAVKALRGAAADRRLGFIAGTKYQTKAVAPPASKGHRASGLKAAGIRAQSDERNEKMNAKVREHTLQKVPFLLVVGEKEAEAGTVNVRVRGKQQPEGTAPITQFVERVKRLIAEKSVALD